MASSGSAASQATRSLRPAWRGCLERSHPLACPGSPPRSQPPGHLPPLTPSGPPLAQIPQAGGGLGEATAHPHPRTSSSGFSLSPTCSSGTLSLRQALVGFLRRMEPRDSSVMLWIWEAGGDGARDPGPPPRGALAKLP